MRGSDERQGTMFGYVDMESRIPADHPLRRIMILTERALEDPASMRPDVRVHRSPEHRAGASLAIAADPTAVLGAQRAAAGRADPLQSAVPVVHRPGNGRSGVEPDDVQQES